MSISSIQAGQAAYNPYATQQQNKEQANQSSVNRVATSDTVQISDEAKQLSQNTPIAKSGSAAFDSKNPPIEAFAIPSWLGQYHPEATNLSIENEDHYWEIHGKSLNGSISNKEQSTLNEYRELFLGKAQFRKEFDSELREYSKFLDSAVTKALEKNGLTGEFDYYQKVTLDQTISAEKVHQDFRENLLNSPQAIELMRILNIDDAVIEGLSTKS